MECIIVGKPNVGKTLLFINLAAYMGVREIRTEVSDEEGRCRTQKLTLDRARRDLVSLNSGSTTSLQSLTIDVPIGRRRLRYTAIDTPGLPEQADPDAWVRHQMAMTLERLYQANAMMHVVDASAVNYPRPESPGPLDAALMEFGRLIAHYVLVANKMDKIEAASGLRRFKEQFHTSTVIGVSAVTRRGFRDLKTWLLDTLNA